MDERVDDQILYDYGRVVFYGHIEDNVATGWWLYRAPDGSLVQDYPYED